MRPLLAFGFVFALGAARADTVVPGDKKLKAPVGDKRDRDGDGVPDSLDKCPDEPEDRDGFEDEDGCPDPDNDRDRILDAVDKCPNEPETYNGIEDEDGCPDRGRINIIKCEFPILDKIYFTDGSARIRAVSLPILDAMAATLKATPRILRVEVQGNADNREAASLGQARALAVKRYLVAHGVATTRLTARSFGAIRPMATNHTSDGRERNRRVEFLVLDSEKAGD